MKAVYRAAAVLGYLFSVHVIHSFASYSALRNLCEKEHSYHKEGRN
jgi:hypothetical protein